MKKILVIIIILNCIPNFGQTERGDSIQKVLFLRANIELSNSEIEVDYPEIEKSHIERAYTNYYFCYKKNQNSKIGQIALKKSDSLKVIIITNLLNNMQGVWKRKINGNNNGINSTYSGNNSYEILIISNNKIEFYNENIKSKKRTLVKSENIKVLRNINYRSPTISELIYSDNHIWSISFNKSKKHIHFINTGKMLKNGDVLEIICGNTETMYEKLK